MIRSTPFDRRQLLSAGAALGMMALAPRADAAAADAPFTTDLASFADEILRLTP